jgi:cytochrome c peroxidase
LLDGVQWGYEYRGPIGGINFPMEHRRRIALPGNGPRALVVDRSRVFVAEYFSDTIAVLDTSAAGESSPRSIELGPRAEPSLARRGEMLFHDGRICYQQWQSCASCHPDGRADGLNWDLLNDGAGNRKNTKSLLLSHRTPPAMARGVRPSAQAAVRAGMHHIDCYLDSLRPLSSPFLRQGQLGKRARNGRRLFESPRTGCSRCHPAPLFTDKKMHALGPRDIDGQRRYDTPTLIEAWRTAPYRHDGHFLTIRAMLVEGRHGLTRDQLDELSQREIDDLVAFVLSL